MDATDDAHTISRINDNDDDNMVTMFANEKSRDCSDMGCSALEHSPGGRYGSAPLGEPFEPFEGVIDKDPVLVTGGIAIGIIVHVVLVTIG